MNRKKTIVIFFTTGVLKQKYLIVIVLGRVLLFFQDLSLNDENVENLK